MNRAVYCDDLFFLFLDDAIGKCSLLHLQLSFLCIRLLVLECSPSFFAEGVMLWLLVLVVYFDYVISMRAEFGR